MGKHGQSRHGRHRVYRDVAGVLGLGMIIGGVALGVLTGGWVAPFALITLGAIFVLFG